MFKVVPLPLIAFFLLISSALAREAIVHITFTDELAMGTDDNRFIQEMYTSAFPDHDFIEINVRVPRFLRMPSFLYRRKAIRQMEKKIKTDHKISHLVISTHGNTIYEKGKQVTTLDLIGNIGAKGLDDKAKDFLKPLIGQFSEDAKVFLNSCKTFCGTSEDVKSRAEAFMRELKIPNGQIYGAEINVASMVPLGRYSKADLFLVRKPGLYALLSVVAFDLFVLHEMLLAKGDPAHLPDIFSTALLNTGLSLAFLMSVTPFVKLGAYVLHAAKVISQKNTGKLLKLENGTVSDLQSAHEFRDADKIYGIPFSELNECQKYLLNFGKASK